MSEDEPLPPPFHKAEKMADIITEAVRTNVPITQGKAAEMAGYKHKSALQPSRITSTERYKRRIELQNKRLAKIYTKHLQDNLKEAELKRPKANYRDLYYAADIMAKHRALATGQATENVNTHGSIVMLPGAEEPENKKVGLE